VSSDIRKLGNAQADAIDLIVPGGIVYNGLVDETTGQFDRDEFLL